MLRPLVLLAIIVALAIGAATQPADAREEETGIAGDWVIQLASPLGSPVPCLLWIEKTDDKLTGAWSCPAIGTARPLHGRLLESDAFEFTVEWSWGTLILTGPVPGSRWNPGVTWTLTSDTNNNPPVSREVLTGERIPPLWGDMNCDGKVSSLDAIYLLQQRELECRQQYNHLIETFVVNFYAFGGDGNLDGLLNSLDALLILQVEAGLIERLPVLQD